MADQRLGKSHIDDTAFTPGSTLGTPMFARFDDAAVDSVDEDDAGILRMSANRNLFVNLRDAAGNERGVNVSAQNAAAIEGDVAHDSPDLGAPVKGGAKAVEHNTDPPIVSADDDRSDLICNPQGMQYVTEGHPNSIHREYMTTGVQTNSILIPTVAAGSQIILLSIGAFLSKATSATEVAVRIGFGVSAVPTEPTTGNTVDGMALSHPGFSAGSGVIEDERKVGGDGEELRLACDVPTGGQLTVRYDYYISTL